MFNARENRNVFSLDLNVPSESLSVTVLGREFQVAGAEQRNAVAHLAKAVLGKVVGIQQMEIMWSFGLVVCLYAGIVGRSCTCAPGYVGNGVGSNGCILSTGGIGPCAGNPCGSNGQCQVCRSTDP